MEVQAKKISPGHFIRNILKQRYDDDYIEVVDVRSEGEKIYIRTGGFSLYKDPLQLMEVLDVDGL